MKRLLAIAFVILVFPMVILAQSKPSWERVGPASPSILQLIPDGMSGWYATSREGYRFDGRIYHTNNPGSGWQRRVMNRVKQLSVHPATHQVFALRDPQETVSGNELWTSGDSGNHFEHVASWSFGVSKIVVEPAAPRVLFALGSFGPYGLGASYDGGRTWKAIVNFPYRVGTAYPGGGKVDSYSWDDLVVSPQNPKITFASGTLYVVSGCCDASEYPLTVESHDGGSSWRLLNNDEYTFYADPNFANRAFAFNSRGLFLIAKSGWQQKSGLSFRMLSSVPEQPQELLALTSTEIIRSLDEGRTWTRLFGNAGATSIAATRGNNDGVLAAAPGGLLYRNRNMNWIALNQGIRESNFGGIFGTVSGHLYAITSDANAFLYRSDDSGGTWKNLSAWRTILLRHPDQFFQMVVDPHDESHLIFTSGGTWISKDAGETWSQGAPGNFLVKAIDPVDSGIVYFTNPQVFSPSVFKSNDGGHTVTKLPAQFPRALNINAIFVDSNNHQSVFFLGENALFHSDDGGVHTKNISKSICASCDLDLRDMVALAQPGSFLLLNVDGHIYRTNDSGAHWTTIKTPSSFCDRICLADSAGTHFFITPGMLETIDAGKTWRHPATQIGPAFSVPNAGGVVSDMSDPRIHPLFLATSVGMYREDLP